MSKKISDNTIYFYSTTNEYGYMSNFSKHPIKIKGNTYFHTEGYFQSQKFVGTKYETEIAKTKSPSIAAQLGRDRSRPLRKDWESVKDNVMREAVLAKFQQHLDLKEKLLATGNAKLVEDTTKDHYWGRGSNGKGKNMLGKILMETREILANK